MLTNPRGIFVTGTDTGVGKTWAAAHLIRELRARGVAGVRPLKPVESGCLQPSGAVLAQDAETLRAAAGLGTGESVVLHQFKAAVAPAVAARQEGVTVRIQELADFCRREGFLVIEGAGGWRAPLAEDGDVQALAVALGLPVLVVADDRLGAINHTLLTCAAVQSAACPLAGVLLNRLQDTAEGLGNRAVLERQLDVPVWQTATCQWLESEATEHLLERVAQCAEVPDA